MNDSENPNIDPHMYGQLNCDKDAKVIPWERIVFSRNPTRTITCPYRQKEPQPLFYLYTKIKSKWVINLNVNTKTNIWGAWLA